MSIKLFNVAQTSGRASSVPPQTENLTSTIQMTTGDADKNTAWREDERPIENKGIRPKVYSQVSGDAPFETLFNEFDLVAQPVYNFWTEDELTNDTDELGKRNLADVPRYVELRWKIAPQIVDMETFMSPKLVNARNINPVIFSRELERPTVIQSRGIGFTPSHLQPEGFSMIKGALADGFLAPGVIESVVEIPHKSLGTAKSNEILNQVDEESYLSDPDFAGISLNELISQKIQSQYGPANIGTVGDDLKKKKAELVDGKFSTSRALKNGGEMTLDGVHPSSPALGFSAKTVDSRKNTTRDETSALLQEITKTTSVDNNSQIKVKFFNPAIGGLIDDRKVNLMTSPEHVESMGAIAPSLPDLEIISRTNIYDLKREIRLPSLSSPKMPPLEYVGYVIEKYARQDSGLFSKVEEIDVPNRLVDTYVDTKIVYGETYRYRIKALIRWTRSQENDLINPDPTATTRFSTQTSKLSGYTSSYFSSEWNKKWAYASIIDQQPPVPPDELTVRPQSAKKRIVITFRLPENPQKDIWKMRLLRKFKDEKGSDVSDWEEVFDSESVQTSIDFSPRNVIFFDDDVDFYQDNKVRIVYAAQCISRHGEESYLSEQLCARLNADHFARGEYPVEFVSSAGVRREYFGAFSTNPVRLTKDQYILTPSPARSGKPPGKVSIVFKANSGTGRAMLDSSKYICRVKSLDTGEERDFQIDVGLSGLQTRQEVAQYSFINPTTTNPSVTKSPSTKPAIASNMKENDVSVKDHAQRGDRW